VASGAVLASFGTWEHSTILVDPTQVAWLDASMHPIQKHSFFFGLHSL
jgi:hypothetical protein